MTELHEMDATSQAEALRSGDVSSVELVQHHLDRIDAHGEALGAFITVTAEQALERAAAADIALRGDAAPFTGVPIAIKDLTFTRDIPTSMGSAAMRDFVPPVNAYVVDLIEKAGFISLGKTNTPEFGLSSYTDNDILGPARTPWDTSRNAGGSSGGAAAAVSAGLVPLAQGSDGGGSIRIPASSCGIFGFKPSRGRVSAGPAGSDWSGLAVDGPLSRTVRDAAALLDAMAHPMPGDIRPLPDPAVPYVEWTRRDPGRLRIARWSGTHLEGIEPGPDALEAFDAAGELLESLGHEVVDIPNPFPQALEPQFNVIWSSGIAGVPLPPEAEAVLRPNTRYWRARGATASAIELSQAMQFLEATTREVVTRLLAYDAVLTPTLALPPQPVEWFNESGDPVEDHHRELLYTPYTALYNMSGQPAASLPLHWSAESLPIGVMLAGMSGQDGALFSLCAQVEAAAPWLDRRPAI
ncbi:amidase [Aeromicrobium panaciterrae]|uniref:amidase n=1 Tax=Aeromicrobium panaciterrae TaxID=363861 RepID=UPI0031DF44D2